MWLLVGKMNYVLHYYYYIVLIKGLASCDVYCTRYGLSNINNMFWEFILLILYKTAIYYYSLKINIK